MNFYFTYWNYISNLHSSKVIVLLFIYCYSGLAQPSLRNFTKADGLPSSEVYDVLQAKNGSMWFATDRGVSNYNGYEFVNYTTEDGLLNHVIYELYEDYKGRIWFLSSTCQLFYWEKDRIKEYSYNSIIEKSIIPKHYLNSFHIDRNETVYIGTIGYGLVEITKDGQLTNSFIDSKYGIFFKTCENSILSYSQNGAQTKIEIEYWYKDNIIGKSKFPGLRSKAISINNDLLCYNESEIAILYDIKNRQIVNEIEFDNRIVCFKWIDEKLYIGLDSGGLHVFKIENGEFVKLNSFLKDLTCSDVEKDDQKGWWITTVEKGIFYSPNLNIRSLTKQNGLHRNYIKYLERQGNKLMIGYGESYQILEGNDVSLVEFISKTHSVEKNVKLLTLPNKNIISKLDCDLYMKNTKIYNECTKFIYPHPFGSGFQLIVYGDILYICAKNYLCKYSNGVITELDLNYERIIINDIEHIDNENFWLGLKTGLFKRTPTELIGFSEKDTLLSSWIVDLVQTKNHGVVMATKGAGVLLFKDDKLTVLNTLNRIVSNDITKLYVDAEQAIWVATNKGLHRIDSDDSSKIDFFNISDGILSNEIKDICRIDNNLYIATKIGLSIVDLETFSKQSVPSEISISNILLNRRIMKNESTIDIYPRHKYLEINYLCINYPSPNDTEYKYRFLGFSDTWYYTKERQIKLFSFPENGSTTLELYAKTGLNAKWNDKPTIVKLRFHPPFYKRWDFRFSMLSLLILIIYAGFKVNLLSYNKLIQQELYNRLLQKLKKNSYLIIKVNTENIRINYNDILYVQSSKDYVEIYTDKNKYLYRTTMRNMEINLSASQFMRVHRSYIVRKDKIDSISSDQIAIGKSIIPIGKTYKTLLKEFAMQFSRLNK